MTIKFLVHSQDKDKVSKIHCELRDGRKLKIKANTQLFIEVKNWNVKQNWPDFNKFKGTVDGKKEYDQLNDNLSKIKKAIQKAYIQESDKTKLNKQWLNEVIDREMHPQKYDESLTFFAFVAKFIRDAETRPNTTTGRPVSYKQRRLYEQTFNSLKQFSGSDGLNWQDIDLDFYYEFIDYLNSLNLATNTVGKRIQTIKVFLNAAEDQGYDVNTAFKSHRFKSLSEESESIYLNESELKQIFDYDFSNNPRLEKVRDLFIIAAWTGLRFGDVTRLTPENIEGDFINVVQAKTNDPVIIPLHWAVQFMLKKHGGELPKAPTNQKFNDYLKEVCKIVGLDESVHKAITKGGVKRSQKYHKYELVTAHTARRSFATNLYKQGFPALSIMQITGHRSESAFLKYIKVTPREHAEKLKQFWLDQGGHLKAVK